MEKEEIMNIIWSKTPLDYRSKPDSPHHPSVLTLEKGGTTLVPLKTLTVPQLEVLAKKHMIELPGNPSGGQVVKGIKLSDEEYKDFVDYLNTFKIQQFTADDVSRWLKSRGNPGNPDPKRLGWGKQAFAEKPWGKGIVSLVKLIDPEAGDVWLVDYNDKSVGKGLLSTPDFNKAKKYFDSLDPSRWNPGTGQVKGVEWPKAEVMINFDTKKAVVYPKDEFNTILNALKPDYDWPKHIPEIYRGEGDHYHAISPEKAISVDGGMVYATMELAGPGGVHLFLVTPKVTRKETLSQIVNDIKRERDVVYHTIFRVEFVTHVHGNPGNPNSLQEVLEKEGDYIRQHGELTEADFSINDIQRDKIQAYWKLHPDAHIGLVNRYDRKRNFLQKYNGEKVLNFEWEFIIPQHDAELLKLLLAREQATYTGTQADVERLKPIWARIEQLGGLYLIWV